MRKERIIIATIKSWNVNNADKLKEMLKDKYDIFIFSTNEELTSGRVKDIDPKYIFFPHWSWMIPSSIYEQHECIVFHMADLPYGRGGSPLQNSILKRLYNTKITAIRVEKGVDTGKVYLKEDIYIGLGSAEEIFIKASEIIFYKLIPHILENSPAPCDQQGEIVEFRRRTAAESDMTHILFKSLDEIYDFIRMLDAEGYPKALIKLGDFKVQFSEVHRKQEGLVGRFEIINKE